jgi:hypothetical protein
VSPRSSCYVRTKCLRFIAWMCRVCAKQTVVIQHYIHSRGIKTWKVDVAGARFCTGRPGSWCVKYADTSSVKQTLACQSIKLPKRKVVLLKCAIQALEAGKEILARAALQFISSCFSPPSFAFVGYWRGCPSYLATDINSSNMASVSTLDVKVQSLNTGSSELLYYSIFENMPFY